MKYGVKLLCASMNINRSGYYKWLARKDRPNRYEQDRKRLTQLLEEEHKQHPCYGYHSLAHRIRSRKGWAFSDHLAHQCCKAAGIRSKARKTAYRRAGVEHVSFPNLIKNQWDAKGPLEKVVSDMTCIWHKGMTYEWVLMIDTFNREIIAHSLSAIRGKNTPYYKCLDALKEKVASKKEQATPTILHTDQGAVYSSRAFAQAHKDYTIIRSMSRVGTPTDNPIIESLNGWIKEELKSDFGLRNTENLEALLHQYVWYYNNERPAYSLDYKTPVQFRIEREDS